MSVRVVLVRPWVDAHGGGGCCGGDARSGICFDTRIDTRVDSRVDSSHEDRGEGGLVAQAYLRLREELPDADVQIVGSDNTAYLLPTVFRSVRRQHGLRAALRAMSQATTPGSVLVDSERVGDVAELGAAGVVAEVRRRSQALC